MFDQHNSVFACSTNSQNFILEILISSLFSIYFSLSIRKLIYAVMVLTGKWRPTRHQINWQFHQDILIQSKFSPYGSELHMLFMCFISCYNFQYLFTLYKSFIHVFLVPILFLIISPPPFPPYKTGLRFVDHLGIFSPLWIAGRGMGGGGRATVAKAVTTQHQATRPTRCYIHWQRPSYTVELIETVVEAPSYSLPTTYTVV
jgi:hypothetical protein